MFFWVVMYGCELTINSRVPKNYFWTAASEDSSRALDRKKIWPAPSQRSISPSGVYWKDWCWNELQYAFNNWCKKSRPYLKRLDVRGKIEGRKKRGWQGCKRAGLHHRLMDIPGNWSLAMDRGHIIAHGPQRVRWLSTGINWNNIHINWFKHWFKQQSNCLNHLYLALQKMHFYMISWSTL